jgi:putative chitinase
MLSAEQLHAIMPDLPQAKSEAFLPFLQAAITEFAIEAPARSAAFLAQVAHESGQFRFMEEIWGPTPAQRRYEPPSSLATSLGNTQEGDGKRFKGRGPIQITGRANYRRFGDLLGIDLVADPPRAAQPETAFRISGLFWAKNGLNELADLATPEAFQRITRRINGGLNGLVDRERFYAVARRVLGIQDVVVERGRAIPALSAPPDQPPFERGDEAIRSLAAERDRKPAPRRKKTTLKPKSRAKPRSKIKVTAKRPSKARARPTAKKATIKRSHSKSSGPAKRSRAKTRSASTSPRRSKSKA